MKNRPLPWHLEHFKQLLAGRARLPHALLFRGPRGIGKLDYADALAAALLCEHPDTSGMACGVCPACHWSDSASHPDLRRVIPESEAEEGSNDSDTKASDEIKVAAVRSVTDFINVTSHRGGVKVVVVHPAEALNPQAANALLKGLEEPPPNTYFLVVTHRPHQLLPTIKSRCQQIALPRPDQAAATAWLKSAGIEKPELALAQAGGTPLLAAVLGTPEYWIQRNVFLKHATAPVPQALAAAEAMRDFELPQVLTWLQQWTYDIASYRQFGRILFNPDSQAPIAAAAARMNGLSLLRLNREFVRQQRIARHPVNPRLFLEQLWLAYADLVTPARKAA